MKVDHDGEPNAFATASRERQENAARVPLTHQSGRVKVLCPQDSNLHRPIQSQPYSFSKSRRDSLCGGLQKGQDPTQGQDPRGSWSMHSDLAAVTDAWPDLPEPLRRAVLAIVATVEQGDA